MQASLFEFRNRWWIIFSIFGLAFLSYNVDPINSGVAIASWIARQRGVEVTDNACRVVYAFGALALVIAAFLRTWGTSYLQADVMRDAAVHTEKLLADGPYRYVRNPLYLGNIFMAVGMGLMASRLGFVILCMGMTFFVLRLLLREESELLRDQGESYRRYCEAVPRLWPSLRPRVPAAGHTAHWGQGIRAEMMYWLLALAVAAFAVTLNIKIFWAIFALGFLSAIFYKQPKPKDSGTSSSRVEH